LPPHKNGFRFTLRLAPKNSNAAVLTVAELRTWFVKTRTTAVVT